MASPRKAQLLTAARKPLAVPLLSKTSISRTALLPTASVFGLAPGCVYPSTVMACVIRGRSVTGRIVWGPAPGMSNWIVPPPFVAFAASIAARREPAPPSAVVVTVNVDWARAGTASSSTVRVRKARMVGREGFDGDIEAPGRIVPRTCIFSPWQGSPVCARALSSVRTLAGPMPPDSPPAPPTAAAPVFEAVYDELRRLAGALLRRHSPGETLNTTGLVHEAYLKLGPDAGATDRAHFFALAARAMRFILVDHARARHAAKRGGHRVTLGPAHDVADVRADEVLALDEALTRLAAEHARLAETVELRFFGGLTHEEVAEARSVSVRTAKRDWELARAWLHRAIHAAGPAR